MKFGGGFIGRRNQVQWAVLLAIAVVLPTVSLLWFMSRVIANERLVVQQKLAALYQDKLADAEARTEGLFTNRLAGLDHIRPAGNPYALLERLIPQEHCGGMVVWDGDGSLFYPRSASNLGNDVPPESPLAQAWQEEFAQKHYNEAAQLYERLSTHYDPRVALAARLGMSRCLARLGRLDEAIAACQEAAFGEAAGQADSAARFSVENARLLLLSLLKSSRLTELRRAIWLRAVKALEEDLFNPAGPQALLAPNQNLMTARMVLDSLHDSGAGTESNSPGIARLEKCVVAEELSLAAAETLRPLASPFDAYFKTVLAGSPVYCLRHRTPSATFLVLLPVAAMDLPLSGYAKTFAGSEAGYCIRDPSGDCVAGRPQSHGKPFAVAALPEGFPGWKVELYFLGGDVFEKAARRQIAVYVWTGILVIALVLLTGVFATRAVGKQIRLNTMKNDFIATVSHELKTPLASMRVLIDTLREGNVRDEAQVAEYLRLTARENERLSRMIDNFLTFSRMERNKVAFSLSETSPAEIARDAVESVKTKFAAHHCALDLQIEGDLPPIQADHDALVTVLVNLLDNACKYTGEHKQTGLRVSADPHFVSFAVSDNGIGLARRHLRKIFDRFYQVDSSLARKAEGCGLGLSIVKFIVDAHQAKITVESKPGQGSTFTVRLPVATEHED